jgi:cellulose biosynthesis protein BcsQ
MGFFVVSAMHAADSVIVPIWAGSAFSIEGLLRAVDLINDIRKNGNPDLRFLRLLINQVDRRTAMTKVTIDQLKNERKTIIRYDPTTLGAKAYRALAKELLEIFSVNSKHEP